MNMNAKIELNKMKHLLMTLTDGRVSILFQLPSQEYPHLKETTQSLQDKSVNQLLILQWQAITLKYHIVCYLCNSQKQCPPYGVITSPIIPLDQNTARC